MISKAFGQHRTYVAHRETMLEFATWAAESFKSVLMVAVNYQRNQLEHGS